MNQIENEFLFDSGAATSLCQQCFSDSFGGKPSGAGVDLRSATGPRFTTTGSTQIFMRTRRGVNVSGDFQIGPKTTSLQRSLISVGRVADRGNSIVFHRSCGTMFNKVTGTQIKFERAGGVYRQKGRDIITESDWDRWNYHADGLRARVRGTFGGTTCDTWNRTNSTERDRSRATGNTN